jgi:hypothetical protein
MNLPALKGGVLDLTANKNPRDPGIPRRKGAARWRL